MVTVIVAPALSHLTTPCAVFLSWKPTLAFLHRDLLAQFLCLTFHSDWGGFFSCALSPLSRSLSCALSLLWF